MIKEFEQEKDNKVRQDEKIAMMKGQADLDKAINNIKQEAEDEVRKKLDAANLASDVVTGRMAGAVINIADMNRDVDKQMKEEETKAHHQIKDAEKQMKIAAAVDKNKVK